MVKIYKKSGQNVMNAVLLPLAKEKFYLQCATGGTFEISIGRIVPSIAHHCEFVVFQAFKRLLPPFPSATLCLSKY